MVKYIVEDDYNKINIVIFEPILSNLKIFSKYVFLLPMIFLFIPSMYFPGGIPVYDVVMGFTLVCFLLSNKRQTLYNQMISYRKYNFVKILTLYILWIFISGLILILLGQYNFIYAMYAIFVLFFYNNISWFLYPSLIFPRVFSIKTLIKILLISFYVIIIYGLLVYSFDIIGIPILKPIHYILVNRRLSDVSFSSFDIIKRVLSVFEEPGYYGGFLCINLPIIYSVILSKYKILRNTTLNFLFKKSYIPLVVITIILIKSPIWLIFSIITTIVYFHKILLTKYLKPTMIILSISIISVTLMWSMIKNIDLSNSYFGRIKNTLFSFTKMEQFVSKEPSLANRVLSYIVRFKIFLKNPITGIGYKNAEYHSKEIFEQFDYITFESQLSLANPETKMHMNGAIFWDILGDTGIVGFLLFYSFLIFLIKKNNQIIKYVPKGLEKSFIKGVRNSYIAILFFSFYDIRPNFHYFWFLYGLVLCFEQERRLYIRNGYDNNICKL